MAESNSPPGLDPIDPALLPSTQGLVRASAGAAILGLVLAVTVVLPAEWGIDPTGVGTWLGLTPMGELKEGAPPTASVPAQFAFRTDELTIELGPREGLEVKATLRAGDEIVYSWETDGASVLFDFHGEPAGAPKDVFTSYEKGQAKSFEGSLEAPFDGVHGWYWKNLRSAPTSVRLKTSGVYIDLARLY